MSKLLEQIQGLPDPITAYQQMFARSSGKEGRFAIVVFAPRFLRDHPSISMASVLEHPDMPRDAEPLFQLSTLDGMARIMFASMDWDLVPEGLMPPVLDLLWQGDKGHEIPLGVGARPRYHRDVKCPHCQHVWAGNCP